MTTSHPDDRDETPSPRTRHGRWTVAMGFVLAWAVLAYVVAPDVWKRLERGRGDFVQAQHLTTTSDGHPGDPVNLALLGPEADVVQGMLAAGWRAADPITLRSSARIAADSVLGRPDPDAPVSSLFLFGRRQDLAFEQPVGTSPRQRHHVRFWLWDRAYDGRAVWLGAATFDERVGLSWTTGQVTHHVAADVDAERDHVASTLAAAGCVDARSWVTDFHEEREGRNGGGDRWRTDGRLLVLTMRRCAAAPGLGGTAR